MISAIAEVLKKFLPSLAALAAMTVTKIDDLAVTALDKLANNAEFIALLDSWLNPPHVEGRSAPPPFPPTYEAALTWPDGSRLIAILERLNISTETITKLWPWIQLLLTLL